jgi:hypothetical protein
MPFDEKTDFKAIAGNAKKSDAFQKMGDGDADEPDADDADGAAGEDKSLGEAYSAFKSNNEAGFKEAMASAMRECFRSMK